MNQYVDFIKQNINKYSEYKSAVFENGFLLTNAPLEIDMDFPFYGNYISEPVGNYTIYYHNSQHVYITTNDDNILILIGHAYNPFQMLYNENEIISQISRLCKTTLADALDSINELTGIFALIMIKDNQIWSCVDYCGFQPLYYGTIDERVYLTSHEELVAVKESLNPCKYVKRLEQYKFYPLYGESLPGNISHYNELKKLTPNLFLSILNNNYSYTERFYPSEALNIVNNEKEYSKVIGEIADTLVNTMEIISKKWKQPAISMTGGRDSKTTLAASMNLKNQFKCFSYNSQNAEKVDCDAAKKICDAVGVHHTTYDIPLDKEIYPEYDVVKAILHVNSNRIKFNHNDIMKRIYFRKNGQIDVEVKSWASEMGRAFYYKKYGFRKFSKSIKPRYLTAMSHIILPPKLLKETDLMFSEYLENTRLRDNLHNFDWTDIFFLEHRYGRWGCDVISCEHIFSNDVTIPYNNRKLCEKFMSIELQKRISDTVHQDVTKLLCPEIELLNINIQNVAHDKKREWIDKLYYLFTTHRLI